MTHTTVTRTVEIDAPVEKVFTFLADPEQYYTVREGLRVGDLTIRDVDRDAGGVVRSYKVVQPITIGRLTYHTVLSVTRAEHVPDRRIVDTFAIGGVQTEEVEPSGTGTRWTHTATMQTRVPLLDKLEVLLAVGGQERWEQSLDEGIAAVKKALET
jgi:uncharacterized protein YndB with AHSA1/START domain